MAARRSEPPIVVITGAASGIGAAAASVFADRGATVYATDVEPSFPPNVATTCRCLELDVTDADACRAVVDRILDEVGRIDILVTNAGFAVPGPVEDVSVEASRRQFDVLVHGTHAMVRAVLPTMRANESGRIIMLSSVLGVAAAPGLGTYGAAKAAVESLADSLRMELHGTGISVSLVEPAWVDTEFAGAATERLPTDRTTTYEGLYEAIADGWIVEGGPLAVSPEAVASAVIEAATADPPAARYPVGYPSRIILASRYLPTRLREAATRRLLRWSVPVGRRWRWLSGGDERNWLSGDGGSTPSSPSATTELSTGHEVSVPLSTRARLSGVVLSASAEGVDAVLPPSLSAVRLTPTRSAVTLLSVDYSRIGAGEINPYNEVAIVFPAVIEAASTTLPLVSGLSSTFGGYVWQLPVTTDPARALGDEIWGYPKSVADIEIEDDGQRRRTELSVDGQSVLSLAVETPPTRRLSVSLSSYADTAGLCRIDHTLDGDLGVRPLSSRFELSLGSHRWADRLRSLTLGGRALLRFGGDCEFTIGAPEPLDTE